MNRFASLWKMLALAGVLFLVSGSGAQVRQVSPRFGVPQDWTSRHLLFSRNVLNTHPQLATAEPRVIRRFLSQLQPPPGRNGRLLPQSSFVSGHTQQLQRDWNVSLGNGRVAFGMSPAKFSYDPSAPPSCTNDYVVFALNVAGSTGGQANLVAFNNLYRGTGGLCGTGNPTVLFAYNVSTNGGSMTTSPVISLDGTKIAFVESAGGASFLHVLTWATGAGNGVSATSSARPGTGNTASMTTLRIASSADTRSSPWIDFNADTAYVGLDNGNLYKITGVFHGTPTLAGAPWPVVVSANSRPSPPVLDQVTRNIFIGDSAGRLFAVNVDTPAVTHTLNVGQPGQFNASILDGPIVDQSNGTVFAVSSNDGTSAVVVQADTATLTQLARARIGRGSTTGTSVNLYDGAFTNDYFNSPSQGFMLVCGTGTSSSSPFMYAFGFTGSVLNTTATTSAQILNAPSARCSPLMEFFNPNVGANGTDFFFWGITRNCTANGTAGGCIIAFNGNLPITFISANTVVVTEPGGTSVTTPDNFSTQGQASSIYFSDQANSPFAAVKLTQNGLN